MKQTAVIAQVCRWFTSAKAMLKNKDINTGSVSLQITKKEWSKIFTVFLWTLEEYRMLYKYINGTFIS